MKLFLAAGSYHDIKHTVNILYKIYILSFVIYNTLWEGGDSEYDKLEYNIIRKGSKN